MFKNLIKRYKNWKRERERAREKARIWRVYFQESNGWW